MSPAETINPANGPDSKESAQYFCDVTLTCKDSGLSLTLDGQRAVTVKPGDTLEGSIRAYVFGNISFWAGLHRAKCGGKPPHFKHNVRIEISHPTLSTVASHRVKFKPTR